MTANRTVYRLSLPTRHLHAFLEECRASDWRARDTGERVMTDEGPDGEAVLLVEPAARTGSGVPVALVH